MKKTTPANPLFSGHLNGRSHRYVGILKSNREKKQDLVATSRAERGTARHVLAGQASETVSGLPNLPKS